MDLSPRSVKLSHSVNGNGAVHRSAAGAVLASGRASMGAVLASSLAGGAYGAGGGHTAAANASAATAAGVTASSNMPWLSMVDDEYVEEEEEEEGEPPHRPARSEASFASLGGRSLSLGGGCRPGSVSGGGDGGGGRGGAASSRGAGGGGDRSLLGSRPAFLAESVYDGVKSKLRRLQEEVKSRDDTITALHKVGGGEGGGCV